MTGLIQLLRTIIFGAIAVFLTSRNLQWVFRDRIGIKFNRKPTNCLVAVTSHSKSLRMTGGTFLFSSRRVFESILFAIMYILFGKIYDTGWTGWAKLVCHNLHIHLQIQWTMQFIGKSAHVCNYNCWSSSKSIGWVAIRSDCPTPFHPRLFISHFCPQMQD